MIVAGKQKSVTVRHEGPRVLVIEDGRVILDMPWEGALAVAKALHIKAKQAEEDANAEKIVGDQAILTRLGIPVGLTNRPDLLKLATNEAAWNSELRRYIPLRRAKGIASQEIFGTPVIRNVR